jgi:hypothetical protein
MSDFCPVLTKLLQSRRAVGKSGRIYEELSALSTVNNLHAIRGLMRETRPLRTLEIGLSFGDSVMVFCASHKELGHPPALARARHQLPGHLTNPKAIMHASL